MALSKTLICSMAAFKLGLPRFTNVETEQNDGATIMNTVFDVAVDELLRKHTWNFAVQRVELAREVSTPDGETYAYYYALPADYLRDITIEDLDYKYKIEMDRTDGVVKLATDATSVFLVYIARITDPSKFDSLFASCLATLIAVHACMPLIKDINLRNILQSDFKRELTEAKQVDAREGTKDILDVYGYDESRYQAFLGLADLIDEDGDGI